MLSKELIKDLTEYLEQNVDDEIWYRSNPELGISDNQITDNEDTIILNTIISRSSDETIRLLQKALEQNLEALTVFSNKVKLIRGSTGTAFLNRVEGDEYIDQVGASLDMASVDTTFYEVLVLYILEAGYTKVSDFYSLMGIDKREWSRYKHGLIPVDQLLYEIFIYLRIEFVEIQFLMNLGGKVFRKNDGPSMIVRYFLKDEYQLRTEPVELMNMIDEALINFGYPAMFSIE